MITLGIDLSAEPKKTGYAKIVWSETGAHLNQLRVGADNDELLALIETADKTGIDCPLGWPLAFLDFVIAHRDRSVPPNAAERIRSRDTRATDRYVRDQALGRPLSVSTDRIGRAAMRVAGLLASIEERTRRTVDRAGSGHIVEVYPAAALQQWLFAPGSYKSDRDRRRTLVQTFVSRTKAWLVLEDDQRQLCERSDDAFDALIAALNARAATLPGGVVRPPDQAHAVAAGLEGWIAVPICSLDDLAPRNGRRISQQVADPVHSLPGDAVHR